MRQLCQQLSSEGLWPQGQCQSQKENRTENTADLSGEQSVAMLPHVALSLKIQTCPAGWLPRNQQTGIKSISAQVFFSFHVQYLGILYQRSCVITVGRNLIWSRETLDQDLSEPGVPGYQMKADNSNFATAWNCRVQCGVGKGFLEECRRILSY